jgi:hypothetical protein
MSKVIWTWPLISLSAVGLVMVTVGAGGTVSARAVPEAMTPSTRDEPMRARLAARCGAYTRSAPGWSLVVMPLWGVVAVGGFSTSRRLLSELTWLWHREFVGRLRECRVGWLRP